ncbi:hypothetical protein E2C01_039251 [Portunus trituberculatus]|uniref:Uncharacterized protein n=1 Tax=Portunus trituberculatus TaxID=210409 RepID=A0A5B7FKA0_PORTR|nr:hypothetical protein [Portunus trituberculatus]
MAMMSSCTFHGWKLLRSLLSFLDHGPERLSAVPARSSVGDQHGGLMKTEMDGGGLPRHHGADGLSKPDWHLVKERIFIYTLYGSHYSKPPHLGNLSLAKFTFGFRVATDD